MIWDILKLVLILIFFSFSFILIFKFFSGEETIKSCKKLEEIYKKHLLTNKEIIVKVELSRDCKIDGFYIPKNSTYVKFYNGRIYVI